MTKRVDPTARDASECAAANFIQDIEVARIDRLVYETPNRCLLCSMVMDLCQPK